MITITITTTFISDSITIRINIGSRVVVWKIVANRCLLKVIEHVVRICKVYAYSYPIEHHLNEPVRIVIYLTHHDV